MGRPVENARTIIENGEVFDAETNSIATRDIYIDGGTVVPPYPRSESDAVIDASGSIVSPGWVDLHAHVFKGQETSIDPDLHGPRTGVTTMIDTGSAGAHVFDAFKATTLESSSTRIRVFLNISSIGATSILLAGELRQLEYANEEACLESVRANPDWIIGIKVRASHNVGAENSLEALRRARRVADDVGLRLMVHVGPAPVGMAEVLGVLGRGDIVTHCFSGHTDIPIARVGREPDLLDAARAAQERGVIFDVGHGMGSFDARRVRAALAAGFQPDSISTDIWRHAPQAILDDGLPHVANKMLALGMSLEDVLSRVTIRPAGAAGLSPDGVGSLRPGSPADVSVFDLKEGTYSYEDTTGLEFHGSVALHPRLTIIGGQIVFSRRDGAQSGPASR